MDVDFLEKVPLFQGFARDELEEIGKLATHRSYEDGATVLTQGELGRYLFIILDGHVDVIQESTTGERTVLARFGPGDYFGERAAMRLGARTANVVARGALECVVLTQWDVLAVLREDQAKSVEFLNRLQSRYVGGDADV